MLASSVHAMSHAAAVFNASYYRCFPAEAHIIEIGALSQTSPVCMLELRGEHAATLAERPAHAALRACLQLRRQGAF